MFNMLSFMCVFFFIFINVDIINAGNSKSSDKVALAKKDGKKSSWKYTEKNIYSSPAGSSRDYTYPSTAMGSSKSSLDSNNGVLEPRPKDFKRESSVSSKQSQGSYKSDYLEPSKANFGHIQQPLPAPRFSKFPAEKKKPSDDYENLSDYISPRKPRTYKKY